MLCLSEKVLIKRDMCRREDILTPKLQIREIWDIGQFITLIPKDLYLRFYSSAQ